MLLVFLFEEGRHPNCTVWYSVHWDCSNLTQEQLTKFPRSSPVFYMLRNSLKVYVGLKKVTNWSSND